MYQQNLMLPHQGGMEKIAPQGPAPGMGIPMSPGGMPPNADFLSQPAKAAELNAMAPALEQGQDKDLEQGVEQADSMIGANPLAAGTREAMQAMRAAIAPSEEDRRRAMGMAIVNWAAHRAANPPQGGGSNANIGSMASAMAPAMQAYQQDMARAAEQNAMLYGAVREEQILQRQLEKQARQEKMQSEKFEETKQYHKDQLDIQKEKNELAQKKAGFGKEGERRVYEDGIPLETLTVGQRRDATQNMTKNLGIARNGVLAYKALGEMKELMTKNPDLWKSFTLAMEDPENEHGIYEYLKKNGLYNEKTKTAIDLFRKKSGDLILYGGEALGSGQRFTDAKLELLKQIKPDIMNTSQANLILIKGLMNQFEPYGDFEKDLVRGFKEQKWIINDIERYRKKKEPISKEEKAKAIAQFRTDHPELAENNISDEAIEKHLTKKNEWEVEING